MAYNCKTSCTRIQYFSSPSVTVTDGNGSYNNAPIGSYCENNVDQINSARVTVANYMISTVVTTHSTHPSTKPYNKNPSRKPSRNVSLQSKRPSVQRNRTPSKRTYAPSKRIPRSPSIVPTISSTSRLEVCSMMTSITCHPTQVTMTLRLDRPGVLSWSIFDLTMNQTACSGGPYSSSFISPLTYCLKSGQKLKLQLRDIGTVGFINSYSTYNVTIRSMSTGAILEYFTKNNGQTLVYWRGHSFGT